MAKFVSDEVLDAELDELEGTNIYVCSSQPVTYADLADGRTLATQAVVGVFTKSDGTTGRKTTCPAQTGMTIGTSGTATHVALATTGDTTLRGVTTSTSQVLTQGGTLDIPAWSMTVGDPV